MMMKAAELSLACVTIPLCLLVRFSGLVFRSAVLTSCKWTLGPRDACQQVAHVFKLGASAPKSSPSHPVV